MNDLFSNEFGTCDTKEEVFDLRNKYPQIADLYLTLSSATFEPIVTVKANIESLYSEIYSYLDNNFKTEFQKKGRCEQRLWELYVGGILHRYGLQLENNGDDQGPDFRCSNPSMIVETTSVEKGKSKDAVPQREQRGGFFVPKDKMELRLTNAIEEKVNQYNNWSERCKNYPFVVAINRSQLGYLDLDIPLIIRVLFEIGNPTIFLKETQNGFKKVDERRAHEKSVQKSNGIEVQKNYFVSDDYDFISAILYTENEAFNSLEKDLSEIGEDLHIVHNPHAKYPVSRHILPGKNEYIDNGQEIINIR